MSIQAPPPPSETLSPDGQYRWDGSQWQSITPPPPAAPPVAARPPIGPPPVVPAPARKKGHKGRNVLLGIVGLIALIVVMNMVSGGNKTTSTSTTASKATPANAGAAAPAPAAPAPAKPVVPAAPVKPAFATFHDGDQRVGTDIKAGTYRTRTGSDGCYWSRLKGFSGSLADIIANDNTSSPAVVTIGASDAGFSSRGCATWTADLSAITTSQTTFGEGTYITNTDFSPGTYHSSGQAGCYWSRLNSFDGGMGSIIANDNTDSAATVTLAAGDAGFTSHSCGTWTKSG